VNFSTDYSQGLGAGRLACAAKVWPAGCSPVAAACRTLVLLAVPCRPESPARESPNGPFDPREPPTPKPSLPGT
jgi:hypothetical protein